MKQPMDRVPHARLRVAIAALCACAAFPALATPLRLAMGPNPGGRLGEDMPFTGDDVIRRAPAATKERDSGKLPERESPPAAANTACKDSPTNTGKAADCAAPPKDDGAAKR